VALVWWVMSATFVQGAFVWKAATAAGVNRSSRSLHSGKPPIVLDHFLIRSELDRFLSHRAPGIRATRLNLHRPIHVYSLKNQVSRLRKPSR